MLDLCLQQLVKQLAPRCTEWSTTLEVIRNRYGVLWSGASDVASALEAAASRVLSLITRVRLRCRHGTRAPLRC